MVDLFDLTPEARASLANNLIGLVDLVKPLASAHIRSAICSEFKEMAVTVEKIEAIADGLHQELTDEGASIEDIEAAVAECREKLGKLAAEASKEYSAEIDELCEMATAECVPVLVGAWVNALNEFTSRRDGAAWLRLSLLGDDMLPHGDKDCDIVFVTYLQECPMDITVARDILRTVRAALPDGKKLPDQMVAALELAWSVVVIP